tara:strand:+ start:16810 stop:17331 length:522 start_codon:yes stop_codon:yes gene_type:complete
MTNHGRLQALLYAHGGEMKKKEVRSILSFSDDELIAAAAALRDHLKNQALELYETDMTLSLRTGKAYVQDIDALCRESVKRDIGQAGLEVLAIVLYKQSASRADIDYIRGANSSGTLRQLVLRGLLERKRSAKDSRAWVYTGTPEVFAHLGITSPNQLPEYDTLNGVLENNYE